MINHGKLILVEEKAALMQKLGRAQLRVALRGRLTAVPDALATWGLALEGDGTELVYAYDMQADESGIPALLRQLDALGIGVKHLQTRQSSLEDIFVGLVHGQ